ncbi:hypothetical protein BVX98_06035 [bacterium F11]|nr:hypothetical protein BVX98_06035 [bacterium F11]
MTSTHLKKTTRKTYAYKRMEQTPVVLRAIIFDCDGVLIDSEPLHLAAFRKTLGAQGEGLTDELYKERYLALDDRDAFTKFYQESKQPLKKTELEDFVNQKTKIYQELVKSEGILAYPAVPEFVMAVSQRYPLAVASGSRRHELDLVLEAAGIRSYFEVVVSADDVQRGKPDPETFLKAVEALNATGKRSSAIKPEECLVIEDSREGIRSAHAAGMKCIAVASSYPNFELSHADLVVPSIAALRVSQVEDLFHPPAPKPMPSTQNN